jgi:hypothetical protein
MCTPVILAGRFPSATCDTPASTCHVIIARAELRDRQPPRTGDYKIVDTLVGVHPLALVEGFPQQLLRLCQIGRLQTPIEAFRSYRI